MGYSPYSDGIVADHYRTANAALVDDPVIIALAAELPADLDLGSYEIMLGANAEYAARGGATPAPTIGAVIEAIRTIAGR